MPGWRKKALPLAEWAPLQDAFGNLMVQSGGPMNLAMFMNSEPGAPLSDIYITGPGIELIEAMSPGVWADSGKPEGEGVTLLVSSGNAWEYFGIRSPV